VEPTVPTPGPRPGPAQALSHVADAEALLATLEADDGAPAGVAPDLAAQASALESVHQALQDAMALAER
jgi:hypothetical protein